MSGSAGPAMPSTTSRAWTAGNGWMSNMDLSDEDWVRSFLRCTLKKSQQVFAKVILLVSYAIVALALIGCGYLLFTGVLIPIISPVVAAIIAGIWTIVAVILIIPWYYYLAGIAILVIPVYSFLWCIARELTDEDWESGEAKALADIVAVVVAAAVCAAVAVVVAAAVGAAVVIVVGAAVVIVVGAAVGAIVAAAAFVAFDSKPMRFPGACLHYWRRMRK